MKIKLKFLLIFAIFSLLPLSFSQAQTVYLQITPHSINFTDADPDLQPLIQASEPVILELEINNTPSDWTLTILAHGDLQSETDIIPVENISWSVSPSPPFFNGKLNKIQPQILGKGKGPVKISAQIDFYLENKWDYSPGSYSQLILFTLTVL